MDLERDARGSACVQMHRCASRYRDLRTSWGPSSREPGKPGYPAGCTAWEEPRLMQLLTRPEAADGQAEGVASPRRGSGLLFYFLFASYLLSIFLFFLFLLISGPHSQGKGQQQMEEEAGGRGHARPRNKRPRRSSSPPRPRNTKTRLGSRIRSHFCPHTLTHPLSRRPLGDDPQGRYHPTHQGCIFHPPMPMGPTLSAPSLPPRLQDQTLRLLEAFPMKPAARAGAPFSCRFRPWSEGGCGRQDRDVAGLPQLTPSP